jgi:transposase
MGRFDLSDEGWPLIAPLLPGGDGMPRVGRPTQEDRRVSDGIFYILRTGARLFRFFLFSNKAIMKRRRRKVSAISSTDAPRPDHDPEGRANGRPAVGGMWASSGGCGGSRRRRGRVAVHARRGRSLSTGARDGGIASVSAGSGSIVRLSDGIR